MTKINKVDYSNTVELYRLKEGCSYLESCIFIADEMEIDHQDIPLFITKALRDKIECESIDNRQLKMQKPRSLEFLME